MCGIAGLLQRDGATADAALAVRMAAAMVHRGPDDSGVFADGALAFAHQRLAVIDVTAGSHQPMTDGDFTIVYNGELYNFREIASQLKALGHAFRSEGDTEVVLHAFREWGVDCLGRFDGMFAFAVWDSRARRLFLARDRFGVKPLYYAQPGSRFAFASEIKPLLEAGSPREADPEAMTEYFTFQNVFSDRTLFKGVRILPAGCWMEVGPDGGAVPRRWWAPSFEPDESRSEEHWAGDVRDAVEEAVRRQLVADVPLGSYLSGGMDSASIVGAASRWVPHLQTFTGGFDMSSVSGMEIVFDEREDAELVSGEFGTSSNVAVMHAGDMAKVLPRLVWHLEDLRAGTSWQNWHMASLAAGKVKVALAGTGGDEVFAGYPWRYDLIATVDDAAGFDERYYGYWSRLVPDDEKARFFSEDIWRTAKHHEPFEVFRQITRPLQDCDPIGRALAFEMQTFLHGLLVVQDRLAMAHSLEERVPFLDNSLVDLASRIPSRFKHSPGSGKRVLRNAMRGVLPDRIVGNPKQGFSPPEGSWYRGESMAYVREILLDDRARGRGYFRPEYTDNVVREHMEGRRNNRLLIWSLLCFEWWNRLFIDGEEPG